MKKNIAIIGGGAIGKALAETLASTEINAEINVFSRKSITFSNKNILSKIIDYSNEDSIVAAANTAAINSAIDLVIVATGVLHNDKIMPEKSLNQLSAEKFQYIFAVNTILPAIIAKYFLPKLQTKSRSIFAVLSARVGSISDNRLGGWYAYRASKAALNMIIKNLAIETSRKNHNAIVVALHPGTVNSNLSKPFQKNIAKDKLFEPQYSATQLVKVINRLKTKHSGKFYDWEGQEIKP